MSTYNGGARIERQINDIIAQNGVLTTILIRDDGSDEETINILKKLKIIYSDRIILQFGKNVGYKKSFQSLLQSKYAHGYDFYGFSDQDDIWMDDKLITCINMMLKEDLWYGPKLAHCNAVCVDEKLKIREEQEKRIAQPLNHNNAFATEYFQGCAMVWNQSCMDLIQKYEVKDVNISHDYWVGLIGYLFGRVYFCREAKFYHIRYDNNESADGDIKKGRLRRVKAILTNRVAYMNPARDLLEGYGDMLSEADKRFLRYLYEYKHNLKYKKCILKDMNFRRPSRLSTLLLKFSVLINRY